MPTVSGLTEIWRAVALPLLLLALAIIGIGTYAYQSAKNTITQEVAANMEAIAKLKSAQIEQWLAEQRNDVQIISTAQLSMDLQQWLDGGQLNHRLKNRLLAQLRFPGSTLYRDVSLYSASDGKQLLSSGKHPDLPAARAQALESARQGALVLEDIHAVRRKEATGVEIGFFKPVRAPGEGQALAVIHVTLDPDEILFPLLQKWPGTSPSAETMLLRREGDEVVFLNALRHRGDSALPLRRPLATVNFVAARLIKEGEGFFKNDDYRGVPSLAYGMPIAGTPWYLVAKMDQAEAYAQLDKIARISAALLGALMLVCAWWLVARKRLKTALIKSFREIEDLYQNAPCGYHSVDEHGIFIRINDTELKLLGYSRDEIVGKIRLHELQTPASLARLEEAYPRFMASGQLKDMGFEYIRKDGTVVPVLVNATAIKDGNGRFVMSRSTVNDMTENKQAEHIQQRLGRALKLLSECNMALVRTNEEQALLDSICRLIVETGGYLMAWVGIREHDAEKSVRVASSFGDESGYLDTIRVSWGNTDLGRGPTGTAMRTGVTQINQDCLKNPAMAPWRDAAVKRGYQSSIALPLTNLGDVFGVLTVYALESNAFGAEEVKLLEQLASDLIFGIESLRARQAHLRAVLGLHQNEERLRALFASIKDAVFVLPLQDGGTAGCFNAVNDVACAQLGYSREELLAMNPMDICAPECQADIAPNLERLAQHKTATFERVHVTKEGRRIPVEISASTFTLHGKNMLVSLVRDITERKSAEQQLIDSANQLHKLSIHLETVREEERRGIARELHDELGQMLTALKMDISLLRREFQPTDGILPKLASMTALVDETLATVRKISSDLRPAMLDDLGLKAAVEWQIEMFKKRYRDIACNLVIDLDGHNIEGKLATVAYRIIQECLTNVVRHAEASKIHVVVSIADRQQFLISVQDNGRGLQNTHTEKSGFGLIGMRERVKALGGAIEIVSLPGEGVSVDVAFPLPQIVFWSAA